MSMNWIKVVSLLAEAGGWCHDLGKATRLFQAKLASPAPVRDAVRHEWVSLRLLHAIHQEQRSWEQAWEKLAGNPAWLETNPLEPGVHSAAAALDYVIATHHRLLGPSGQRRGPPDASHHVSGDPAPTSGLLPQAELSAEPWERAQALLTRIDALATHPTPTYWRAVATLARAALIMADHRVSSRVAPGPSTLYANTHAGQPNQPLDWHLRTVAAVAGDMATRIATLRAASLDATARNSVCRPAADPSPYAWQNTAADALSAYRDQSPHPMLLLNMASTGSGKTRMNARAACILGGARTRFAVALNLRTLTLQTGEVYREQLGLGPNELACIIGDRVTLALHAARRCDEADLDGNPLEREFVATGAAFDIPAWMEEFARQKPYFRAVVGAPVLVSTVDFLAAAGMPHKQGHHVAALLRFADSDLVLDEVDGYDPKPLVAMARLIQMAALFGRNVICSTATLAEPVAIALYRAYQSGAAMRGALENRPAAFGVGFIDNAGPPRLLTAGAGVDFSAAYRSRVAVMQGHGPPQRERVPFLQPVSERSTTAWLDAVGAAVARLHQSHAWLHTGSAKSVSFGLVRVANIGTALAVARYLAARFPEAQVAAYHSGDFLIQRFLKEKRLDQLLQRSRGDAHLQEDAEISARLAAAPGASTPFIVVATPVEEIGRDHDFDWAAIEPSSTRSIIQTSGRVNRHRRIRVTAPNIALLQFNVRWARGKQSVFCRPGYETAEQPYPTHDLAALLNWDALRSVDAGLMFGDHAFARLDHRNIQHVLETGCNRTLDLGKRPWWIGQHIYDEYPLRENDRQQEFMLTRDGTFLFQVVNNGMLRWVDRSSRVQRTERVSNDWLAWSPAELFAACGQHAIKDEDGMRVSIRAYGDTPGAAWDASFGFTAATAQGDR